MENTQERVYGRKRDTSESERIKAILKAYKMTAADFSRRFGIPAQTVQQWTRAERTPAAYVLNMAEEILSNERERCVQK